MKNKKGFTLIELLAIIVILAVIAVITVPLILGIIDEAKQKATEASAYGYKDAVEKNYITKMISGNEQYLNGTYTVLNGKLNNQEIPISGIKPSNGTLTYENNKLVSGCLTIDGYKVQYQNDKFTTTKGNCEEVISQETLFFTFDADAEEGPFGKITQKLTQFDESWTYYIKETTQTGVTSYVLEEIEGGQTIQQGAFETLSECETILNINSQEIIQEYNIKCVEKNTKTTNEVCGVENETTFCLKPNDYENSVTTLNTIFPECNADASSSSAGCIGLNVNAHADSHGNIYMDDNNGICNVSGFGGVDCYWK